MGGRSGWPLLLVADTSAVSCCHTGMQARAFKEARGVMLPSWDLRCMCSTNWYFRRPDGEREEVPYRHVIKEK